MTNRVLALAILVFASGCSPTLILKCDGCYVHEADIEQANVQPVAAEKEGEDGN